MAAAVSGARPWLFWPSVTRMTTLLLASESLSRATAVARLKDSDAKSKVVILVTDGQNNQGLAPLTAAAMAEATTVKVYTIGVVPAGLMQKVQDMIFGAHFVTAMPT